MKPRDFSAEKDMKPAILIASVCFVVLLGASAYFLVVRQPKQPAVPDENKPATATVTMDQTKKVPVPPSFESAATNTERKETLLALAKKSVTTKLTSGEKAYILQEFGGERAATYSLTYDELKLILDALNR